MLRVCTTRLSTYGIWVTPTTLFVLMVLSNWALQRGYSPQVMNDWFRRAFVDGYPWVMTANVIGMGLYADGGEMATKPYVSGGGVFAADDRLLR